MIPVSCFTATAKQNVIDDIKEYIYKNLGLELKLFTAKSGRKNLSYTVIQKSEDQKYNTIRNLLDSNCSLGRCWIYKEGAKHAPYICR